MLLQRIINEPLLHFLAIALVIYWFQGAMSSDVTLKEPLSLSVEERAQVAAQWRNNLGREPRSAELNAALNKQLLDKMLFEEALHLGLHREDKTIYETLVQRLKQLLQTPTLPQKIERDLLYRYYQEHQDNYRQHATISFSHVFLSIEHDQPFRLADAMLKLLQEGDVSSRDISQFGDECASNDVYDATQQRIETEFGKSFYTQVSRFKKGVWSGPVISNTGIHLVKVNARKAGEVMPYETIKDIVISDYIDDLKRRYYQEKVHDIRAEYGVVKEIE